MIIANNETSITHDLERVQFWADTLLKLSPCIEVRVLRDGKGPLVGYFDDPVAVADEVERIGEAKGFFVTVHELKPETKDRVTNRLASGTATGDTDVASYRWLILDFDPDRPSGVSSTDEEKEQALMLAEKVRAYLDTQDFPAPILADSGNGYHLLYYVKLPVTDESRGLMQGVLRELSERHSTKQVKIDTSVHNPSRILKLYGTVACKGSNTEERPHRLSSLVERPQTIRPVKEEQLKALLPSKKPVVFASNEKELDVEQWLAKHEIATSNVVHKQGASSKYKLVTLAECPFDSTHEKDKASYVMQFDNGGIYAGCHHDRCNKETKNRWPELWKAYEGEEWASEESKLDNADLADLWVSLHGDDWRYDARTGAWFHWVGTHWKRCEAGDGVKQDLDRFTEQVFRIADVPINSMSKFDGVMRLVENRSAWKGEPKKGLVNFRNGTLDTTTMELREHRKEDCLTRIADYDYRPGAHPNIDRFLEQAIPDEIARQAVMAHMGLSMMGDTTMHYQIVIKGAARAGKSTLLDLALVTSGEKRGQYAGDSLFSTELEGKRERFTYASKGIVCVDEVKASTWHSEEIIKRMFAHGGVEIRGIGRDAVAENQWLPKIIIATNETPHYKDISGAIQNRLIYVESGPAIPKHQRDRLLFEKFLPELGAFAYSCISLAKLALDRGYYPQSVAMKKALDEASTNGNVLKSFVEEMCVLGSDKRVASKVLFAKLREYCEENNHTAPAKGTVSTRLKEGYGITMTTPLAGPIAIMGKDRYYKGIDLGNGVEQKYTADTPLMPIAKACEQVEEEEPETPGVVQQAMRIAASA